MVVPPTDGADRPNPAARRALLCIGASTGGIAVLDRILPALPPDCPPVLVVQHILDNFIEGLVRRLDGICAARVRSAADGAAIERGTIYIAPGDGRHLVVDATGSRCHLVAGPPVKGHRPSVDALFLSVAAVQRPIAAALLTGMGSDGAEGMQAIHRAGGLTIAQDAESCTVYGMPRAAVQLGAVQRLLPPDQIAAALLEVGTTLPRRRAAG
jgi:two-component system chemotaxis response regulator CheB